MPFKQIFSSFNDNSDSDSNITCNILVIRNQTLVVIQRGWEGIPESIVINLTICLIFIVIFLTVRLLARYRQSQENSSSKIGWLQFVYGNRCTQSVIAKNGKRCRAIHHHLHDLNQTNVLLPTIVSNNAMSTSNGSQTIDLNYDSCGEDIDNISNDTIQIQFNRGSHQNLVELENESHFKNMSPTNSQPNGDLNQQKSFYQTIVSSIRQNTRKYIYWIIDVLNIKDDEVLQLKGRDALQYLVFQRYIIYFLVMLTFICLVIVLPVNIQGKFEGESKAFGKTTISNLEEGSNLFWIHAILAAIVIPIGVFMMNHFSKVIKTDEDHIARRTLLIRRIPQFTNIKEVLINYFGKNFPDCVIGGIQLVYDFRKLESLEKEFSNVVNAKAFCEEYNRDSNKKYSLRPYCLGQFGCCCCCCCSKTDGFEYYSGRQLQIASDIRNEMKNTFSTPTGSVFITFQTEYMAMEVYKYLKERENTCNCCQCFYQAFIWISSILRKSSDDSLEINRWQVSYAPYPDDINWKDMTVDYKMIWLRKFGVYLFLFVVFFFLSTPSILLKVMEFIANQKSINEGIGTIHSTFTEFLSPLFLMLMTVVLPTIVIFACEMIPYKTRSALNHAIMWKVFVFLLMMVIILPSAGFLSTNAFLENFFTTNSTKRFRWQCLFPVDNGAFFVNYALQAAFIGNTVEILRLPELFLYIIYNIISRSSAEYENARKQVSFDFEFGVSYPRFLLIFSMVVTYSLACPLIAPCGLFYMIYKHIVDRYNIYHIYTPTKINGRIHSTAVLYVHIALLMMQFQVFTFLLMRTRDSKVTAFSMIVLLIALLVFAGHCFFHWFRNINHLTYSVTTKLAKKAKKQDYCACAYSPPVINDLINDGIIKSDDLVSKLDSYS